MLRHDHEVADGLSNFSEERGPIRRFPRLRIRIGLGKVAVKGAQRQFVRYAPKFWCYIGAQI